MSDRTDGYLTDIAYTHGYYSELNPLRTRLALLNAGFAVGKIATACELGFGHGISIALHAAASPTRWYGTDINSDHAGFARDLAAASGSDIGLHEDSFEEFGDRPDLPTFDYIGMHGVWAWISDRNRAAIVAFVQRKLKPGGVVYVSYNALPGWSGVAPIRHLLAEHARRNDTAGGPGIAERIDESIAFFDRLLAAKPAYAGANPRVADWFKTTKNVDRRYLAHEYFNRDWAPMYFAEITRWLAPAGLSYACSADFGEHIDMLSLSAGQRDLLGGIDDPDLRESTRDFIINQEFRRDCWIREPRTMSAAERAEALRAERVIATTASQELPFKVRAALALNKSGPGVAACEAVLEVLADREARTLGEIERIVGSKGHDLAKIVEAVIVLASCRLLTAAQDDAATVEARPRTDRLNAHLIERARTDGVVRYLASPVTGGGIRVTRAEQLFLSAWRQGKSRPEEWAREATTVIAVEGVAADLADKARTFARETLPLLQALQVV
jgi:SAM-dependent methyltransferase